jgi:hypothetical protein
MITVHSSDEELRLGLRDVERENRFRNLAFGNKRLEDRGSLKTRDRLVSHTQKSIRRHNGRIEIVRLSGRAKILSSSLIIVLELSVARQHIEAISR